MPGRFRLVLLACLSHSSVTYPVRWIDSTIKHVVLYGTYKARDQSMKSAGDESAYLGRDTCDVRCLTVTGLRIFPVYLICLPDLTDAED